jgi:hypothetical protein
MNDELKNISMDAVMAFLRYCPAICLEGLRKTTKNLRIARDPTNI